MRLTQGQPWVPFSLPHETKTRKDEEEYALFERMEKDYTRRNCYGNNPKSYNAFADAWDVEVANRFREKHEEGKHDVVLIHRKSTSDLQTHYDNLQKHKVRTSLAERTDMWNAMETGFRDARRMMPPRQQDVEVTPPQYNNNLGNAPFGNPTALSPEIAAAAVTYNNLRPSLHPFNLRPMTVAQNPITNTFRKSKYCWKCGFPKREHMRMQVPFGQMCSGNCLQEECSKCLTRVEFHDNGLLGPYCTEVAHTRSNYNDWYKQTGVL
jgi:hypothetical protein